MIFKDTYESIADYLNDFLEKGSLINGYFSEMIENIGNSGYSRDSVVIKKDFIKSIIEYKQNFYIENSVYSMGAAAFMRNLQTYVFNTYGSIDLFLSSNNLKVKTYFADLSEYVGFEIDPSNIEDVS